MGNSIECVGAVKAIHQSDNTEESLKGAGALKGKSPYEIAVDNGYTGTEQEWLESLKGSPESLLSDEEVSEESTWSSAKISEELKKISESGGVVSYHETDNDFGGKTVTIS